MKKFMYVLMGTMLVVSSCSETELGNGESGSGTEQSATNSPFVNVYADEDCSEASLLAGDFLLKEGATRTLTLNAPIHADKVYMKYNTVSGGEAKKTFALTPVARGGAAGFSYATSQKASVTLALPEDAVKPTSETDAGYLFYHNTGVAMFEDGWPTKPASWYDEDFNDVVFEYDLKVTECQDAAQMEKQGGKEGLTGAVRTAQLEAFRELILNTNRQNFFIKTAHSIEIHMKGYAPTSAYQEKYKELVAKDSELDANIPYTNVDGYTWGVKVPVGARHAFENISFAKAYTGFTEWIDSNGASNKEWYLNPDAEKTVKYW